MFYQERGVGLDQNGDAVTSESHAIPENRPGAIVAIPAKGGTRFYRYMKAETAFAIGQVATLHLHIDNADVDAAAATTSKLLVGTGDFVANEFNDGTHKSAFVTTDAGTGVGQTHSIVSNKGTTDTLTTDRVWDTALDATTDYVTYDLNYVAPGTTPGIVMGVAISAITDEQWGWFQVKGFCPLVRAAGDTDPLVAGEGVVLSAAAGVCKGYTAGGTVADEAANVFGFALHALAVADAAGRGAAVILDCKAAY